MFIDIFYLIDFKLIQAHIAPAILLNEKKNYDKASASSSGEKT